LKLQSNFTLLSFALLKKVCSLNYWLILKQLEMEPGTRVIIKNLATKPELNGTIAVVLQPTEVKPNYLLLGA
jgi:hypothetical protein